MQRTANLHQEVDANAENKGRVGLHASEASMSSSNARQCLQLRVWNKDNALEISSETSDRNQVDKSKVQENKKLLKLLDERLRILEEDDENLKGEFMNSVKERSELISEVREHFEDLRLKKHEGEKFSLMDFWPLNRFRIRGLPFRKYSAKKFHFSSM